MEVNYLDANSVGTVRIIGGSNYRGYTVTYLN